MDFFGSHVVPPLAGALATCVVLSLAAPALGEESSRLAPVERCIESPADYEKAWAGHQIGCVSPSLFVTVFSPGQEWLYPSGFWYAWAGGHDDLEMFLRLNQLYGDRDNSHYNPNKVLNGVTTIVGFPTPTLETLNLAVYMLPAEDEVLVPTFATWLLLLERELGLVYPLEPQKGLAIAYSGLADDEDVIDVYADLSGCPREKLATGDIYDCGYAHYRQAIEASDCSPYDAGCTSRQCFRNFFDTYTGPKNRAAIRGSIAVCQDASPLNTGMGIGYNTLPNPFVCKPRADQQVDERYTGREFILLNRPLNVLPASVEIPLPYSEEADMTFIEKGYCQ